MRDAVRQRISAARRAGLEHRTRDVPLQEVDLTPGPAGQVDELVNEQALARAGQPREEDHPAAGQGADPLREPLIGVYHDTRAWCLAHARPVAQPP